MTAPSFLTRDVRLSQCRYYDLLVHIFVVILLVSNLVGQKICVLPFINLGGHVPHISGAQLLFPLTYIFADVFTEVYGYGAARRAIWMAFFANVILTLMGIFVTWFPAAPEFRNQAAFEAVFYTVPRFVVGSLVAFWLGEFTNSYTLAKMKVWTDGKWLWTRFVGSTVTGQFVDTVTIMLIAFGGRESWATIGSLIFWGYSFKVIYEICVIPLSYLVVNTLKRAEGIDAFDKETNFNPFARERDRSVVAV